MIICIYAIVIFIATCLGAIAGLGGGVIIKPVLDLIQFHDVQTISFISTCAVFSMAVVSLIKQICSGFKVDWIMVGCVALGAFLGGNIGNRIFQISLLIMSEALVVIIQAVLMTILLLGVLYTTMKEVTSLNIKHPVAFLVIGFLLGCISSFLGIGGGPMNVAVFMLCFGVTIKKATIFSIATILFSQFSKLVSIMFSTGFNVYDTSVLFYVIPVAIIGGFVGAYLNQKFDEKKIKKVFIFAVMMIIVINILIIPRTLMK